MRHILWTIALLLLSSVAVAKPHTLTWTWPTQDCEGQSLDQASWVSAEIIYDTEPMPMPSDTDGPCGAVADPDGPLTATSVPLTTNQISHTLNLQPGVQYFARIRVCYYLPDNCSNWSNQTVFTVPYGRPRNITSLDGG